MKVAILVDALVNRGGVERIVLSQAKHFNADIYVGIYDPNSTFNEFTSLPINTILNKKKIAKLTTLRLWYKFSKLKLDYDFYIFHGAGSLNAAKNHKPNIMYCHSPSRYLYDLHEVEYKKQTGLGKLLYPFVTSIMRRIDQKNIKHIDLIAVNSKNIQARVKKYYNRDSRIIYPFVNTDKFRFIEHGDFFLSSGRLDPIKRIHLIINAFKKLPEKRLVIVSDGPDRKKLEILARGYNNIKFLGYVTEKKLHELYGKCLASIYLSYKEDFGIVPIESMAAGKPCIAINDGGFKETIIHKKTGYLVDDPTNVDEVIKAIKWTTKNAKKMRKDCEERAKLFSEEKFIQNMREVIEKSLAQNL